MDTYVRSMYVPTYLPAYLPTYIHTHTYIHPSIHQCIHPSIHQCIHPSIHACIQTSMRTSIHLLYIHPCIIHTSIHTYIHPYIRTLLLSRSRNVGVTQVHRRPRLRQSVSKLRRRLKGKPLNDLLSLVKCSEEEMVCVRGRLEMVDSFIVIVGEFTK